MRLSLTIMVLICVWGCADGQPDDPETRIREVPSSKTEATQTDVAAQASARAAPQLRERAKKQSAVSQSMQKGAKKDKSAQTTPTALHATSLSSVNAATEVDNMPLVRPKIYASLNQQEHEVPLGLLPSGATPLSYVLELDVDPTQETFAGRVEIAVKLDQPTKGLYLHGQGLSVSRASARLPTGEQVLAHYAQVHSDGVAYVRFEQVLDAGQIVLEFDYSASFGRLLHGLYKVVADGNAYAFTQMESVYARQAFPSFDEPAFKTPFELTLTIQEDDVAIANMPPVETERLANGKKQIRFAKSPPMTTYLFAIAVGPLDVVDAGVLPPNSVRSEPLPFRGVAIAGKGAELGYALRETGALLTTFERYFDRPYPYAKLDIIAVPDFDAGAMENIGAITFREKLLLLKDDAPPQQKRAYASVMAHELAHMWFGNLVTMPWWDDIWLNESFATWMSYKAVNAYDPSHKPFVVQRRRTASAMREDRLTSARQIREPVENNDDIVAAFDGITYSKGGAVLAMLEQYIGPDLFRQGIREHLQRFAHGSATVHDLIDSLSRVSGRNLAPAAKTFLFQNGVPLVEVTLDCEHDRIELSQSRFLPVGSTGEPERLWTIPVCMRLGYEANAGEKDSSANVCLLLEGQEQSLSLEGKCPDWVLPNDGFSGYYHWLMPQEQTAQLMEATDQLSDVEWLSVVDSVRSGFASGQLTVEETWSVIEKLAASSHPSVARSLVDTVKFMMTQLADNPQLRWNMRARARSLYSTMDAYRAFDKAFLDGLPDNETRIHYSNVASFMAEVAYDSETRRAALAKARVFLSDEPSSASVSRSTLDTLLTVAVQDGGQAVVDQVLEKFHASDDAWFRDLAVAALARSRDAEFGEELRALGLGDQLRRNEIRRLYLALVEEDVNVEPTWAWLKANVDTLAAKMPARHVSSLAYIGVRLCDSQYRQEMDEYLRPTLASVPGGERSLNKALEELSLCAAAREHHQDSGRVFFSQSVSQQ